MASPEVEVGEYTFIRHDSTLLGSGGYGRVWSGKKRAREGSPEHRVAIKEVAHNQKTRKYVNREKTLMTSLKRAPHENVIRFYDTISSGPLMYFVLELCTLGDLNLYMARRREVTFDERFKCLEHTAAGVCHLHRLKLCHRDIKPGNVLVTGDNTNHTIKIADFGLARVLDLEGETSTCELSRKIGTQGWTAPEIPETGDANCTYSFPVDIFSLGLLFLSVFKFRPGGHLCPPGEKGTYLANWMRTVDSLGLVVRELDLRIHGGRFVTLVIKLIQKMLAVLPGDRPTIEEVCTAIQDIRSEMERGPVTNEDTTIHVANPLEPHRHVVRRPSAITPNMTSHPPAQEASQPEIQAGLLLTHDWTHLHTGQALLDTILTPAGSQVLQTETFSITNAQQYHAFVSGRIRLGVEKVKGCPVQLTPCQILQCTLPPHKPVNAFVKVMYQVTYKIAEREGTRLCDEAIDALRAIEAKTSTADLRDAIPEADGFLKNFGSHCEQGEQLLGKCFCWMVMVDEETDMSMLKEIANELFDICEAQEMHFLASYEGTWYNPVELFDTSSWGEEKKHLLTSVKLLVSHSSSTSMKLSLKQWTESPEVYIYPLCTATSNNIISAWDLITNSGKEFTCCKKLAAVIRDHWIRLVESTQHSQLATSLVLHSICIAGVGNPWNRLVKDLGMAQYFPCKLRLQTVCSLHIREAADPLKKDLPWRVLEQMIQLNVKCREQTISSFARTVKPPNIRMKSLNRAKTHDSSFAGNIEMIPHPMDMVLLLFTCSDFRLRQLLAIKLSMCRLAIPFIVPTPEKTVEILLWPLRQIILEWRTKHGGVEEALVNCSINMIAFMRSGQTRFSKSQLLNDILAESGHSVFFHQDAPCGNEKRIISNGVVEMTHFLPAGNPQDRFTNPALFFNLRGNACDYPIQEAFLLDLATVVVILVDVGELHDNLVQRNLKETAQREQRIVLVLTDDQRHSEGELENLQELLLKVVDNAIDESSIVTTFEMDGSQKFMGFVKHEIREMINNHMEANPQQSLESFVMKEMSRQSDEGGASVSKCFTVDEVRNDQCSRGKEIALDLLQEMEKLDMCERKAKLLPRQGDCLLKRGMFLRKLHRNSSTETLFSKEAIEQCIQRIREQQLAASGDVQFLMKLIAIFHHETTTKEFAIKWVQLKLDAISRAHLPELQSNLKNKQNELTKARCGKNIHLVPQLMAEILAAEDKIPAAMCGWVHLMREIGQLYEVSLEMNKEMEPKMCVLSDLPEILSKQLLEGQPVELMNGDHGYLPVTWVKAVFSSLSNLVGHDKRIFVLSIIGIQSSGKSTLLNTMFGLEFTRSVGRCARGIYAQLLPAANTAKLPFDYMLVLDCEGLRAHERGFRYCEYDNELATLCVGLADLALINIKGENMTEVAGILQIVVHAFLTIKLADSARKRKCMFVHQNINGINIQEKLAGDRHLLHEQLNTMTRHASTAQGLAEAVTSFNSIASFDSSQDVVYFADLWQDSPPMSTVNQRYSIQAAETQQRILAEIPHSRYPCITLSDFIYRVEDVWKGVLSQDFKHIQFPK